MIYLNGQFISPASAQISIDDRGLLLGDGLFETIRTYQGHLFALHLHWQRLLEGAALLKLPIPLSLDDLQKSISKLLLENQLTKNDASVRITVTRGTGQRGLKPISNPISTILITTTALEKTSPNPYTMTISRFRRNEHSPLSRFKTTNYLDMICARQEAHDLGYTDAIMLNSRGSVVSATCANVFIVQNSILYTPSISSGALPGITRQLILELVSQLDIELIESEISVSQLQKADETFLTNSLIEIQSVKSLNNISFNNGKAGIVTLQIQNAFHKQITH